MDNDNLMLIFPGEEVFLFRPIDHYKENEGLLYFGPAPNEKTLKRLKEELDVDTIWNMAKECTDEFEMEYRMFNDVVFSAVEDFNVPFNPSKFLYDVDVVCNKLYSGKNVFVHCWAGHGRTGLALACLAFRWLNMKPEDALVFAKEHCGGPERDCQMKFVKQLFVNASCFHCGHTSEDHGFVGDDIRSECCICSCIRFLSSDCDEL